MRALMVSLIALAAMASAGAAAAADTQISAGPDRVALVELYTSEGCSSCPPADRALSRLVDAAGLWQRFVPVAFHVGYWDDLGWPDRFADPAHARRQRSYADHWGHNVVYTPGVVLDGQEWRSRDIPAGLRRLERRDGRGRLAARIDDSGRVSVRFDTAGAASRLEAHAAVLGFGLTTAVPAGENAGRELRHDFVVLDYATAPLASAGDGARAGTVRLDRGHDEPERLALAVWVSRRGSPAPVQAAGGWLSR